jgi:HSP20 family protein
VEKKRGKEVKMMTQLDIWSEMMALERRFDDLAREVLGPKARVTFPALPTGFRHPFLPAADVFAREDKTIVRLELPGIDVDKDVKVSLADHDLVVSGERKKKEEVKEEDYYRMEASYGSFERHFPLAGDVKEKDIKANYHDGVLEIEVPTPKEAVEAKKVIPIAKSE